MSVGQLVRAALGPAFKPVGEAYRRIFVDMPKIVAAMESAIPPDARILDVGAGDGYVAEILLRQRPDLRALLVDLAADVGSFLSPETRARVELRPKTAASEIEGGFAAVLLFDVLHHVPAAVRGVFLSDLGKAALRVGADTIIVKDVQPGHLRSYMGVASDRYITGDKDVSLVAHQAVSIPGFAVSSRAMPDPPNYLLVFHRR